MDLTTITGTVFDVEGSPAAGAEVWVSKVIASDQIIDTRQQRVAVSDEDGLVSFTVPRNSTAWIFGSFYVGATAFNVDNGIACEIPDSPTATLESLGAAVAVPSQGLTVKSNNTALAHLIATLDFSTAFNLTESPTGEANVDLAASLIVTQEQVQDALTTFFPDAAPYDWTYDDANNKVGLVIAPATTAVNGLMSAADKTLLDAVGPRNAANGYAGLSAGGLLTESQIPSSIARDSETTAAIDAEAAIRASADTTLQNNINSEAVIRAAADALLQPLDSDLTAIAALTPTNDDIVQRKAGVWTNRTPAQLKTDLVLVKGDVGLGSVDNTSDANKPVSTAGQTALNLKANLISPSFTTPTLGVAIATSLALGGATIGTHALAITGTGFFGSAGSAGTPAFNISAVGYGAYVVGVTLDFSTQGANRLGINSTGLTLSSGHSLVFNSGAEPNTTGNNDLFISRNAAGIGQAGGTAANAVGGWLFGRVVVAKTGNYPIVAATDNFKFFTNAGASGAVVFTLPTAVAGLQFTFYVAATQTLQVTAGASTTIRIAGSVSAAAGNITNAVIGGCVTLVAISATEWVAQSHEGTWTVT